MHLSIGSRQTPLPQRILGRDLFRYLEAVRLDARDRRVAAGSAAAARRRHADRLQPPRGAAPARHPVSAGSAVDASGREVRFADGSTLSPAAVIWATGFALDHSFVQAPVFDEDGQVVHRRGVTEVPGLYFLGLPWQHTRGSALLGWVKNDAEYIAAEIAKRAAGAPARTGAARPVA